MDQGGFLEEVPSKTRLHNQLVLAVQRGEALFSGGNSLCVDLRSERRYGYSCCLAHQSEIRGRGETGQRKGQAGRDLILP